MTEGPITRAVTLPITHYVLEQTADGSLRSLPFPSEYSADQGDPAALRRALEKAVESRDPAYKDVQTFLIVRVLGKPLKKVQSISESLV